MVGSAKKPDLGRFVDLLRSALGRAHVAETPAADEADLVINVVDEDDAEAVPAQIARHLRRRSLRA